MPLHERKQLIRPGALRHPGIMLFRARSSVSMTPKGSKAWRSISAFPALAPVFTSWFTWLPAW